MFRRERLFGSTIIAAGIFWTCERNGENNEYSIDENSIYLKICDFCEVIDHEDRWLKARDIKISYGVHHGSATNCSLQDKYIGLRIVEESSITHYWVIINISSCNELTLKSFGRCKK